MTTSKRMRVFAKVLAVALSIAMPTMLAMSAADARVGGGGSSGSRGSRSFSAPPSTTTAPNAARPFERSMAQPGRPNAAAPASGGFFNRPGMGMLGGLAAGFLGAGLLGMLFGGGFMSGLGGMASIIGLLIQVALVVIVVRLAMNWWRRRNAGPTAAFAGPIPATAPQQPQNGPQASFRTGFGLGGGSSAPPLVIAPEDYEAFEKLLGDVQAAWSNEDTAKLHTLATPEMVSYFTSDLAANSSRGVVNKVSHVKLEQGDLAESWREDETDYATVAMRFSLVDKTTERATGKVVDGSDTPTEATEVWTFARRRGEAWELSAIQQA